MKVPKFLKSDNEDWSAIKEFIGHSCFYGVLINFSLFVIFHTPFTYYSWLGWGIAFWFIETKFVTLLRKIIRK